MSNNNDLFSNFKIYTVNNPTGNLRAHGSTVVAGVVRVKFSILEGKNGLFASFPAQKGKKPDDNGKPVYYPDVIIEDDEVKANFQQLAVQAYKDNAGNNVVETGQTNTGDSIPF